MARAGEGSFDTIVPDGSITLDLLSVGEGCTLVWWYCAGGLTTSVEDVARIDALTKV